VKLEIQCPFLSGFFLIIEEFSFFVVEKNNECIFFLNYYNL